MTLETEHDYSNLISRLYLVNNHIISFSLEINKYFISETLMIN